MTPQSSQGRCSLGTCGLRTAAQVYFAIHPEKAKKTIKKRFGEIYNGEEIIEIFDDLKDELEFIGKKMGLNSESGLRNYIEYLERMTLENMNGHVLD